MTQSKLSTTKNVFNLTNKIAYREFCEADIEDAAKLLAAIWNSGSIGDAALYAGEAYDLL